MLDAWQDYGSTLIRRKIVCVYIYNLYTKQKKRKRIHKNMYAKLPKLIGGKNIKTIPNKG